ncbi:hypothetical protein [Calothrix sp. CCY 0018]|uniref:hypothetical protein n=1 Tax=Calothrix sp. CCY 0018 TaxID=3103864 RepID=UPI0039C68927
MIWLIADEPYSLGKYLSLNISFELTLRNYYKRHCIYHYYVFCNQKEIRLTVMQLPSSKNQGENNQSSAELHAEVETLSNIASNIAIDSEMQAKIQSLLAQIKTSLQQQQLSIEIQRELARLLSLISTLDYRNSQQVDILDLAISILLENKEDTTQSDTNTNFPNKVSDKSSRNLVFIQEARRQIAIQSREYPNPFSAIIKGTGGAYNRLLSGLSWFFIIFVVCPLLGVGLTFVTLNFLGARKEVAENNRITQLKKEVETKEEQLKTTNDIANALQVRLSKVNRNIDRVNPQLNKIEQQLSNQEKDSEFYALIQTQVIPQIQDIQSDFRDINKNIDDELKSVNNQQRQSILAEMESKQENTAITQSVADKPKSKPDEQQLVSDVNEDSNQLISFTDWFVKQDLFFISLAVSMGALGSAISVIVRANKFIAQGKEGQSDLFFTGFFRPIVGMSFAIFTVALIESGIFSGILTIAQKESRNVYLYMAIAFVAGFSERLVEDVVLKTENTLTGFSSRSDKPEK